MWIVLASRGAWAGPVTVEVEGAESDEGWVVRWWTEAGAFPLDVTRAGTVRVRPSGGRATCALGDLPAERLAVAVFHDEDADDVLDVNLLGMPSEAYGFSNGAAPRFRAPRFDEAAVVVGDGVVVRVELK